MDPLLSSPHTTIPDDDLVVTTGEPWVRQKVQLIRQHLIAFTTALANQVDEIIVLDLFAKNGLYCLGAKREIFSGIPIMSLQEDLPITRYVFCENDPEQFKALKVRVNKYFREKNAVLMNGRPDELVDKLKMYIPESRRSHRVATLCIADSFSLEPSFELIKSFSEYGFTFLVPLTFHLGAKINHRFYLNRERLKVNQFLGAGDSDHSDWNTDNNLLFYKQLVGKWENRVSELGFDFSSTTQRLDSGLMEIPTYQMCLLSSKYSSKAIQTDALSGSNIQFALFNQN
ncbi:MAG: three-Cys-motif partner protein TcmP [Cyclobacteriaceae bacterium]|nr:three-Cys-motif partner protein TcmP [Cyclobacteriaceae bacterium]